MWCLTCIFESSRISLMPPSELTVYVVTNERQTVLYIGVTNDLLRRLREHRLGKPRSFASRYHCTKLVWCELFRDPMHAIECEKRLKGWTRAKKEALIAEANPGWRDLGREMFGERLAPLRESNQPRKEA